MGQPVSTAVSCPQSTGSPTPCIKSPTVVPGLTNVAEVHAGENYTCARKNDMTVWCWGSNFNGTLGDGTNTSRSTPAPVVNLDKDVVEIATGRWFACARHAGGTVSCWGQNDSGQLGNQMTGDMNKPVAVLGITTRPSWEPASAMPASCMLPVRSPAGDRTPTASLATVS